MPSPFEWGLATMNAGLEAETIMAIGQKEVPQPRKRCSELIEARIRNNVQLDTSSASGRNT